MASNIAAHMTWDKSPAALECGAMITITDMGADKVREYMGAQSASGNVDGLRVGVKGGGCSGFQYVLAFDAKRDGDEVVEHDGFTLLINQESLPYVKDSTIDFVDGLMGAGFKVENPNVAASCGCGSSFRLKEETEEASCSAV
jgi:iron-sulfur cluster assembly protein